MGARIDTPEDGTPPVKPARTRGKLLAVIGLAGVALIGGLSLAGVDDVIDLPAWASIPGVDIPILGDIDQLACQLEQVEGTTDVRITLIDGDESNYSEYVYVFNNGDLREPEEIRRVDDATLISPSRPFTDEQYYSIADAPVRESRVFCNMIVLDTGDAA